LEAYEAAKEDNYELFIQKRGGSVLELIKEKVQVGDYSEPEQDLIEENIEQEEEINFEEQ
jgi:hypothetical protein